MTQFEHNEDNLRGVFEAMREDEKARHIEQFRTLVAYVKKTKEKTLEGKND